MIDYKRMLGLSVQQEGSMIVHGKVKMFPGVGISGRVPLMISTPIIKVTDLVAKLDTEHIVYFSLN